MSMIGNFLRVPTKRVEALRENPHRITRLLYPSEEGDTVTSDDVHLDLNKAWHGIHYLLNGDAWEGTPPLDFIVGGQPIGDVDVGYGPARGFTADEVRAIATALAPITGDMLRARFDPKAMMAAEIYPTIWDRDPAQDDTLGWLLDSFENLKEFVLDTAEAGAGMIVYLN